MKKYCIFIVEDELCMWVNLVMIFKMEGYDVIEVSYGVYGVVVVCEYWLDFIFCDVFMLEFDGYGVLKVVCVDLVMVCMFFVFFIVYGDKLDVCMGMNLGVDDYLVKLVEVVDVVGVIQVCMQCCQELGIIVCEFMLELLMLFGLMDCEVEVLFWFVQGKVNLDICVFFNVQLMMVKKYLEKIF